MTREIRNVEERKGSESEEMHKVPGNVGDVLRRGGSARGSSGAVCRSARLGELRSPGVGRTHRVVESVLEAG